MLFGFECGAFWEDLRENWEHAVRDRVKEEIGFDVNLKMQCTKIKKKLWKSEEFRKCVNISDNSTGVDINCELLREKSVKIINCCVKYCYRYENVSSDI